MKNSILSIILFLVLLFSIFIFNNYINSVSNNIILISDTLENTLENEQWEKSYNISMNLYSNWEKHSKIISLYVNSSELDTLNEEIIKLSQYIETKTLDEALVTTHVIKFSIKELQSLQKINLQNIF